MVARWDAAEGIKVLVQRLNAEIAAQLAVLLQEKHLYQKVTIEAESQYPPARLNAFSPFSKGRMQNDCVRASGCVAPDWDVKTGATSLIPGEGISVLTTCDQMGTCYEGIAYTPATRYSQPKLIEREERANIVVTLAGPVAEYRVNRGLFFIDLDTDSLAWSLRALLPRKHQFTADDLDTDEICDACELVHVLAACRRLEELDEYERDEEALCVMEGLDPSPKIDFAISERLWPLAQQAHAIIDRHWSLLETLSCHLLKTGSLGRADIQRLVPFAGDLFVD